MVLKVAVEDRFQFKVVPNFRNFCLLKQSDVHYIGGTDVLPAPLAADEEADAISKLGTQDEKGAKSQLIEHNLRLVVYIAKKFDNTGVGVEDLISIGTIGLIKAINSYNPEKNIKLATYASRCIENEILMCLRKNNKKKPLLVACDVYRPAAIDQLKQIGKELNIEVYSEGKGNPVEISKNAIKYAKDNGYDYVLIDTAGRLQIDESLMEELDNIQKEVNPDETILVIDSMMGQDAINVINGFNDKIKLSGVILTKLDGDTRGGVALSVKHLTNLPIKFIGVSEKMDGLTPFYPERMASRILGMGDILSIVEKVQDEIDEKEAEKTAKKMMKGNFDLEDFLNQLNQIKKLGPLENILKLLPGAKKMGLNNVNIDPKIMKRTEAIVLSMTPEERRNPSILKASRKKRIADGSGTTVTDVNRLLNQFEDMKKMMKMMSNGNFKMPF